MSHYSLLVLLRPEDATNDETIDAAIERLMEPYSQYLEVEPYEDDCWECAGLEIPDPNCEECHGTGRCMTTANPQTKYDWYQRGGRFTGALVTDYNPENDPANQEPCSFCSGPNKRYERKDCVQCHGTGVAMKAQWRLFEQDVLPVPAILRPDFVPFAVLTPDGTWKEVYDVETEAKPGIEVSAKWEREYRALINAYPNSTAVLVDFHS